MSVKLYVRDPTAVFFFFWPRVLVKKNATQSSGSMFSVRKQITDTFLKKIYE